MIKIALNMLPLTLYLIRIPYVLYLSLPPAGDLIEECVVEHVLEE